LFGMSLDFVESEDSECHENSPSAESGLGGRFGHFQLVGMGSKANENCGQYIGLKVCLNIGKHNALGGNFAVGGQVLLDGKNARNKVFVRKVHHSCNKPSCPECFKYGWAVREARMIEARILEGETRFLGKAEHFAVSPSFKDLNDFPDTSKGYEKLRRRVLAMLTARGIVGGCLIFHGFRFRHWNRHWFWSAHFHCIGFVLGGYSRCRGCMKGCVGCDGFEARTRKEFQKDGCIVKVAVDRAGNCLERKSIYATALYELRHATIRDDVVRPHTVTWFGSCSYRKLKVVIEKGVSTCPICHDELHWGRYVTHKCVITNQHVFGYRNSYVEDYYDLEGYPSLVYSDSSGSYEELRS